MSSNDPLAQVLSKKNVADAVAIDGTSLGVSIEEFDMCQFGFITI